MSDKAVISLQVGNYANYVGTHFWNFQESSFVFPGGRGGQGVALPDLEHDVLFRQGETLSGEVTFTPRLVAVDLKGALGLLPELGDLYGQPGAPRTDSLLWAGATHVSKEEPVRKNDFQRELEAAENCVSDEDKDICEAGGSPEVKDATSSTYDDLDDQVRFWSDYLRPRFHPRTNVLLSEYKHGDCLAPFDVFGLGRDAFTEGDGEEVEDRVRFFAEESDGLQGFQLVSDPFDAFGGLSAGLLDLLSDEYSGKSVLAFPVTPTRYGGDQSPKVNAARYEITPKPEKKEKEVYWCTSHPMARRDSGREISCW